jgi:GTPase Era involved in 16S rRNA processing
MSTNKLLVATLIHGLNYSHGTELYEKGVPKIVDRAMANKLLRVTDNKPFTDGTKGIMQKFDVREWDEAEAHDIINKYGNIKKDEPLEDIIPAIQPDVENTEVVVIPALSQSEITQFFENQQKETIEAPTIEKPKAGRSKPQ